MKIKSTTDYIVFNKLDPHVTINNILNTPNDKGWKYHKNE